MAGMTRREFARRAAAGGAAVALPPGWGLAFPSSDPLGELARDLRGPVYRPGGPGYARARLVYNQRYDGRRPQAIAQPLDTQDVQALVQWAARHGTRLAIRSGGHSYAGYSTVSNGVMVDLRRLSRVTVGGRSATIGPGAQLVDVYSTLAGHGRTIPAGSCPAVGLGGHSLGGGMGLAARQFGLTADNLRAATIVTADGRAVRCDPAHDADLFWALRGAGGGSFGIVTSLELTTHRVSNASWFFYSWPWSAAGRVLEAWQRFAPHAPRALTSILTLSTGSRSPGVTVFGQYFGTPAALRSLLAPLTRVRGASVSSGSSGYLDLMRRWAGCLHTTLAACHTRGTRPGGALDRARFAAKSHYVARPLGGAGRAAMLRAIEHRQATPSHGSGALILDAYGGAINRVAPDATAFVHRDQLFCVQELAYFPASATRATLRWLGATHAALAPHASGQAYQNYTDPDLASWRHAYYGTNYARLTHVKRRYDPGNLFRFAQSIPPA
jgi:FAD/FMN-containing dehydrogenase